MAHIDPTVSIDSLPSVAVTDVDTAAEGADTWVLIIDDNKLKRISLGNLMTVIDTLMEEAGEVHSHA